MADNENGELALTMGEICAFIRSNLSPQSAEPIQSFLGKGMTGGEHQARILKSIKEQLKTQGIDLDNGEQGPEESDRNAVVKLKPVMLFGEPYRRPEDLRL